MKDDTLLIALAALLASVVISVAIALGCEAMPMPEPVDGCNADASMCEAERE